MSVALCFRFHEDPEISDLFWLTDAQIEALPPTVRFQLEQTFTGADVND